MKLTMSDRMSITKVIAERAAAVRRREAARVSLAMAKHDSPYAESIRLLALNLRVLLDKGKNKAVAIISPRSGEGRTSIAANLALVMAESNNSMLVESGPEDDLHLRHLLRMESRNGADLPSAIPSGAQATGHRGVWLLPSGLSHLNHAESALRSLLTDASRNGVYTVVDTPPATVSSGAFMLAREVGQAIYIVHRKNQDLAVHRQVKEQLDRLGVRLLGLVTNEG